MNFIYKKNITLKSKIINYNFISYAKIISIEKNIKILIYAPIIKEQNIYKIKKYIFFPNGLLIKYFNKKSNKILTLKADYCKYSNIDDLYNIKGNVIINSDNKNKLFTSNIIWDNKKKIFFNKVPTKIYHSNGIFIYAKNGIESSYDLKKIILHNVNGVIRH